MSVAFRRESDEEHKEPRFELPLPPGPNLVTPHGLAAIEEKARSIETELSTATDEEAVAALRRELRYWDTRRTTAIIAPPPSGDEVSFGMRVTFRLGGAVRTVTLVGSDEADPAAGLIAFTAPLAVAMIGAGPGDAVDFNAAPDAIEIIAVEPGV